MSSELFPVEKLSKTETDMIVQTLSEPVFKKYFRILAANDLAELVSLSVTERDNGEVAKKHALVQGKLSTLAALISITKPKE